ncbi:hypothetical protein [Marinobacter nauticus]|uniref:hypothetical protein n=1 Tax=Marinobacter nauticus TaxID=2743 RepID=UPI001C9A12FB|nr:hypothetical protein [Marinobacter nauticus]MBY5962482.1 hypothetical protein [Marinobacter nauticus]
MKASQLSHVKVFLLAGAMVTFSTAAVAEDYLVDFVVNGQSKGEFLVSRNGDEATAEAAFWRAAGVNANTALPIERLNGLGRVKIVWSEQKVYLYHNQISVRGERPEPEAFIDPEVSSFDVKSLDYNLTHHSQSEKPLVGSIIGTGRVGDFDLDVRAGVGGHESYFSSQWHNEDNAYVKDVELGRVQRQGFDGIALTNETYLASGSFATDRIELYWPTGTRVDVYRDGAYIESLVLERDPFPYEIELDYSNNRYEFRAVLPDGRTDTRVLERAISGRLAPVGQFNYRVAAGQLPDSGESLATGYIAYGLTNTLSLFTGQDHQERGYLSALYAQDNLSFEPSWYGSSGYAVNGSWQNDDFSVFGRVSDLDDYNQKSVSLSYRALFRPSLQYSSRSHDGYEVQEITLRTYHSAYLRPLRSSVSLSPYFSVRKRNGVDTDVVGGRLLANLPNGWQAVASYERESYDSTLDNMQRFRGEISKRFRLGRLTYRHTAMDHGRGWATQQQSVRADLWNWEFATLSAAVNRSSTGEKSFSLSISGSFGRSGFTRIPQRNQATLELTTCRDENADGICQADEPEVTGIAARVGERRVITPAIVDSLTPYRRYNVEVAGDFGLSPRYRAVESGRLVRGGVNRLRLPLSEIQEVEGQLEQDGIRVALVDKATGNVLSEQTTNFGGWYLFYAPAHKEVEVVRADDINLSHVKENESGEKS